MRTDLSLDEVHVTDAGSPNHENAVSRGLFQKWSARHSLLLLTLVAVACLLPFSNKALHMDDPLFVWTAQHIVHHPLDPYGFSVVWYITEKPIADVTKNPPGASYYLALFGSLFGWSERSLHLAFLLPALATVLGTYRLANRFTQFPLLAAAATLFAPGFFVSSTTLMCDVLMLAFWTFAVILWLEGLERFGSASHWRLLAAVLLIGCCALTKYFGAALIPLLFICSFLKDRRLDRKLAYQILPVLLLLLYQYWTQGLYGRGLLSDASQYARFLNRGQGLSLSAKSLVALAFTGGCALPALLFAPVLWSRRVFFAMVFGGGVFGLAIASHPAWFEAPQAAGVWSSVSVQMTFLIIGGLSALCLVATARRPFAPHAALPALWLVGTFVFAAFLNWTVNARSILPMIPAVAILITQRLERSGCLATRGFPVKIALPLFASAAISFWVAAADANLANTGRTAANQLRAQIGSGPAPIYFEGHWGFQFYMQQLGAKPADIYHSPFQPGDIFVIPENTTNSFGPPPRFTFVQTTVSSYALHGNLATMSQPVGAGFYASVWGPLPFTFGAVPPERYLIARLTPVPASKSPSPLIFPRP